MEKIIIYALGSLFEKYQEKLEKNYDIIAYSDKDNSKRTILTKQQVFIEPKNILHQNFNKIIICGSNKVKVSLYILLEGKVDFEKIVLVEEIFKKKITWSEFNKGIKDYSEKNNDWRFQVREENLYPILDDIGDSAGKIDEHYFLQDIWFARKIGICRPDMHFDIGSRIDGFISHLLVLEQKVSIIDIRPLEIKIDGLNFQCSDATFLSNISDNTITSLSSLHAVEHFGLGRYGDLIYPNAWSEAIQSMQRVVRANGKIYFSVPCGKVDKLCFNAHRVFNPYTIVSAFNKCELVEFAYISNYTLKIVDVGSLKEKTDYLINDMGDYSCGMFVFRKSI